MNTNELDRRQFVAGQKVNDYKVRFRPKNAELFSYLPADLDPSPSGITRPKQGKS